MPSLPFTDPLCVACGVRPLRSPEDEDHHVEGCAECWADFLDESGYGDLDPMERPRDGDPGFREWEKWATERRFALASAERVIARLVPYPSTAADHIPTEGGDDDIEWPADLSLFAWERRMVLLYRKGVPDKDIARLLDKRPQTVGNRVTRIRQTHPELVPYRKSRRDGK